jgi:serine phosphatase RsbU (regulator of sigma subunit)/anti-sigma regulatory factor (Ser/Thr protein kinase)
VPDVERKDKVLIVDDTPSNVELLGGLLEPYYEIVVALNGQKALEIAGREDPPDIILLDIVMPGMDGYEVCRRLKADPGTRSIPVIFITAKSEESDEARGLEMGAVDYITKPYSPSIVRARIKTHLSLKHSMEQLQRAYNIIEFQKRKMEDELNIGRQIQSSFFPEALPQVDGWEIVGHFQAARQVSGDFFDAFVLGRTDRIGLVVADICDKGVGAALFMVVFRSLIRAFSEDRQHDEDSRELLLSVVSTVNTYITTIHDGSNMFATVFFGVLDARTNTLSYVNAGHELPIVVGAQGGPKRSLEPTGPAIGLAPDLPFSVDTITLERGEMLVVYTDGVVDARNMMGESFSEANLMSLLERPYPSAFSLLKHVEHQIFEYIPDSDQFDDVTMLVVRHRLSDTDEKHELTQQAVLKNLASIRGFIEQASINMGLDQETVFAFKLAVDEACTNIVSYGYKGRDPGPITLTLEGDAKATRLTIVDQGVAFDPGDAPEADTGPDWQKRQPGGLGLVLIKEMVDDVSYRGGERQGQKNTLVLTRYRNRQ